MCCVILSDANEENNMLKIFRSLDIDKSAIGLNWNGNENAYFCTPIGAEIIGWLGVDGIHFCFIPSLSESMVFVVSPSPCGQNYTEPIAYSFTDFLRLILNCRDASPLEQISWMDEIRFKQLLESDGEMFIEGKKEALEKIEKLFNTEKMPDPYSYVKAIQNGFDYSSIPYSDEYYDATGIEKH